ncbi:hypothetical protein J6Z19_04225 [bacterium]|nr:hypothetical protein [bacterium]
MSLLPEIFTGIAAALVTAWFTKSSDDKKNSLKFITDERRKWRNGIRKETETTVTLLRKLEAAKTLNLAFRECFCNPDYVELQKHIAFFESRLNPFDEEDNAILNILRKFLPNPISAPDSNDIEEFQGRIALLLKHDWERSKTEVSNKWKFGFVLFTIFLCAFQIFLFSENKIHKITLNDMVSFCCCDSCDQICKSVLGNQIAAKTVNFIREFLKFLQKNGALSTITCILTIISAYYILSIILRIFSSKILKDYSTNRCFNVFFELFGVTTRVAYDEKDSIFKNKFCCIILKTIVFAVIILLVWFIMHLLIPIIPKFF